MNILVVTAVIGGIDKPKAIPVQSVDFKDMFYTIEIPEVKGNDRMHALYYKCQMHEKPMQVAMVLNGWQEPDVLIWLDGKVQVQSADFIEQIIAALGENDIAVLKHHERNCIYQEVDHIEHCMKKGNQYLLTRYKDKPIRKQVEAYRYFGYPANNGLHDCCIIAMRNNHVMHKVCNDWWRDVYKCNGFDQVALQYYCWLYAVPIQSIVFKPGSFSDIPHTILK